MAASPHAKSRRNHFAGYRVSTQTSLRDALLTGTDNVGKENNRILFLCRRRLQKSQNLSSSSKKRFFFFVFFFVVIVIAKTTMTPALLSVVVVVFRALSSSSLAVEVLWWIQSPIKVDRCYDKRVLRENTHKREENKKKKGGEGGGGNPFFFFVFRVPNRMYNLGYHINRKRGRVFPR